MKHLVSVNFVAVDEAGGWSIRSRSGYRPEGNPERKKEKKLNENTYEMAK